MGFFPPIPHGQLLYCWRRDRQWGIQDHLALQAGDRLLSPRAWGRLCVPAWVLLLVWPQSLPAVSQRRWLWDLGNVLSNLCCVARWMREQRMSPGPLYCHYFPFFKSFVFKRRVNCFALTLQWYFVPFKFPFLRDANILHVQAVKLWQVAGIGIPKSYLSCVTAG